MILFPFYDEASYGALFLLGGGAGLPEIVEEAGIVGGHGGKPGGADLFAGPPLALGVVAARFGEMIAIEDGADIHRGFVDGRNGNI